MSCLLQQLLPAGPGGLGGTAQGLCLVTHPCEMPSTEPAERKQWSTFTVVPNLDSLFTKKTRIWAATSAPNLLREQSKYKLLFSSPLPQLLRYYRCLGISEMSFLCFAKFASKYTGQNCKVYIKIYWTKLNITVVDSEQSLVYTDTKMWHLNVKQNITA